MKEVVYAFLFGTWCSAVVLGMLHDQYGTVAIAIAIAFLEYPPSQTAATPHEGKGADTK